MAWKTIHTDIIPLPIEEKHLELTDDGVEATPETKKIQMEGMGERALTNGKRKNASNNS
jgi:hypothetical protein